MLQVQEGDGTVAGRPAGSLRRGLPRWGRLNPMATFSAWPSALREDRGAEQIGSS